jgi:hypothetical protein
VEKNLPGGIGDMSQFSMFGKMYNSIYDLSRIDNGSTWDTTLQVAVNTIRGAEAKPLTPDEANGYEFDKEKGIKKIRLIRGKPYGFLKGSGKKIEFKSLHFQGAAKKYIPYYFTGNVFHKFRYIRASRIENQAREKKAAG